MDLLKKIAALRKSGDSVEKACAKVKLSVPTFYFWKKRKPVASAKETSPAPTTEGTLALAAPAGKTSVKTKPSTLKPATTKKTAQPTKSRSNKTDANKASIEKIQPASGRDDIGSFFSKDKVAIILIDKDDLRRMFSNL